MNKRQNVWNRLQEEMKAKRKRPDPRGKGKSKKSGSAPHELIVQRLASESDNKQTFRPVHPREFVPFPYEDLTLANLKKACADHYSLPASLCDVLVTNKGPSCTNIEQIPHRKDKVSVKLCQVVPFDIAVAFDHTLSYYLIPLFAGRGHDTFTC